MIGDENGNFNPDQNVTRNEMAVVMANLMEYNVASYKDTSPFTDVPSWAEPYVAACYTNGITSGYSDTVYGGSDNVTTAQAALMLMKALGYFQYSSDFGSDWQLATTRQGNAIDLFVGVDSGVTQPMTRNDVAQLVLNTLKSGTVEASTDGSWSIGDVTINNNVTYSFITSNQTYATAIDDARSTSNNSDAQRSIVELGEQLYMGDLKLNDNTTDVFGRPARYWEYEGNEIGTYTKTELLRQEYTTKVTGRDLYDLLGKSIIDDYSFDIYVDGETEKSVLGDAYFTEDDLTRANDDAVGDTGNGVLTQVYQDIDNHEITIAVINTYLAKAQEDYDEKNEEVDLTIYELDNKGSSRTPVFVKMDDSKEDYTVESDEFDIADVAENDLFLVTVADGAVQSMVAPEILSDTTIANFRLEKYVTADGTQYDYADTVMYDEEVLDAYDDANMKDITYNVILDPYGYMIGIEQNEDPDQYVFLTGIDGQNSNLSVKTADANVIFMDGTMDTVKVKMDKSTISTTGKNLSQLNTWCTYTVDKNGSYTLEEVASAIDADTDVAQYAQDVSAHHDAGETTKTINKKYVSLNSSNTGYVYGNDDSVYINVELKNVVVDDNSNGGASRQIIDDVESITTGVKNANLVMENLVANNGFRAPAAEIYTLYNDDGYVIAAVTIGENDGASSSYAYITSSQPNREAYDANTEEYTWTREAVVNGEIVELTEVGDTLEYLSRANMKQGEWYEIKYDADGNVRKVVDIDFSVASDKYENTVAQVEDVVKNNDTVLLADTTTVNRLEFKNGTLYTSTIDNRGFSVSPDAKIVLALADKTGSEFDDVTDGYTGYNGLQKALRDLNANAAGFTAGTVEVSAVLESGVATSIVINDKNAKGTTTVPGVPGTTDSMGVTVDDKSLSIDAKFLFDTAAGARRAAIANALVAAGVDYSFIDPALSYVITKDNTFYTIYESEWFSVSVDGEVVEYVQKTASNDAMNAITMSSYTKGSGYIISEDDGSTYTYKLYSVAADQTGADLSDHVDIKTGYVKAPMVASITGDNASGTITVNYENDGTTGYIEAGATAEITIPYAAGDLTGAHDITATSTPTGTTVSTDTISATEATSGKDVKLTYVADADVTALAITETAVVAPTAFSASVSVTDAHGLTVTIFDAPTQAKAGETVTVTVAISGAIDDATGATLTLNAGNWVSTQVPVSFTRTSGTVLTADNDANFGSDTVYAEFTYLMTGSSDTVTVTVA